MFGVGLPEIIVIFFVIFLLFGAGALEDIARTLGRIAASMKSQTHSIREVIDHSMKNEPKTIEAPLKTQKSASVRKKKVQDEQHG